MAKSFKNIEVEEESTVAAFLGIEKPKLDDTKKDRDEHHSPSVISSIGENSTEKRYEAPNNASKYGKDGTWRKFSSVAREDLYQKLTDYAWEHRMPFKKALEMAMEEFLERAGK